LEVNNREIGQRIRNEREKLNLTREKFAEIIGLSDYYIGQLERGERQMSLPAMVNIANCLHISLDYLIFGETEYNNYCIHESDNNYGNLDSLNSGKCAEMNELTGMNELLELIGKCSPKELDLIKKLIKTILPYMVS